MSNEQYLEMEKEEINVSSEAEATKALGIPEVVLDTAMVQAIEDFKETPAGQEIVAEIARKDEDGKNLPGLSVTGQQDVKTYVDSNIGELIKPGACSLIWDPVTIAEAPRQIRPTRTSECSFPVKQDIEKVVNGKAGTVSEWEEIPVGGDGEIGVPEILGPNGSTGMVRAPSLQASEIDERDLEILDKEVSFKENSCIIDLGDARSQRRKAQRAKNDLGKETVTTSFYNPAIQGYENTISVVNPILGRTYLPYRKSFLNGLNDMAVERPALQVLIDLKDCQENGFEYGERVRKDTLPALKERLEALSDITGEEEECKKLAKEIRDYEVCLQGKREMYKHLRAEALKLNKGMTMESLKHVVSGEEESPLEKSIRNHTFYGLRFKVANILCGTTEVKKNGKTNPNLLTKAGGGPLLTATVTSEGQVQTYITYDGATFEDIIKDAVKYVYIPKDAVKKDRLASPKKGRYLRNRTEKKTVHPVVKKLEVCAPYKFFGKEGATSDGVTPIPEVLASPANEDLLLEKFYDLYSFKLEDQLQELDGEEKDRVSKLHEQTLIDEAKALGKPHDRLLKQISDVKSFNNEFMEVLRYVATGRSREHGEWSLLARIEEACKVLAKHNFDKKVEHIRKERLVGYILFKNMIKGGQPLQDALDKANVAVEAAEEAAVAVLEEREEFYEEEMPLLGEHKRTQTSKGVVVGSLSVQDPEKIKRLYYGLTQSIENHDHEGLVTKEEGEVKTRKEMEDEADDSLWNYTESHRNYSDILEGYFVHRLYNISAYAEKVLNEKGIELEIPFGSLNEMLQWSYSQLDKHLGNRHDGKCGDIEMIEFKDGSKVVDSREQTHDRFGRPIPGINVLRFMDTRQGMDIIFGRLWDDLVYQVWGEWTESVRSEAQHMAAKVRFAQDIYGDLE